MRTDFKTFVGLDVHKDSIAIAYADASPWPTGADALTTYPTNV